MSSFCSLADHAADVLSLVSDEKMLRDKLVAKSIKALNHEEYEGHQGKEKLFFMLFVVPFFSEPFATSSFARTTTSSVIRSFAPADGCTEMTESKLSSGVIFWISSELFSGY